MFELLYLIPKRTSVFLRSMWVQESTLDQEKNPTKMQLLGCGKLSWKQKLRDELSVGNDPSNTAESSFAPPRGLVGYKGMEAECGPWQHRLSSMCAASERLMAIGGPGKATPGLNKKNTDCTLSAVQAKS